MPICLSNSVDLPSFESRLLKSLSKIRLRLDSRFPSVFVTKARNAQSTDLALTVMVRRPEERDSVSVEVNRFLSEAMSGLGH